MSQSREVGIERLDGGARRADPRSRRGRGAAAAARAWDAGCDDHADPGPRSRARARSAPRRVGGRRGARAGRRGRRRARCPCRRVRRARPAQLRGLRRVRQGRDRRSRAACARGRCRHDDRARRPGRAARPAARGAVGVRRHRWASRRGPVHGHRHARRRARGRRAPQRARQADRLGAPGKARRRRSRHRRVGPDRLRARAENGHVRRADPSGGLGAQLACDRARRAVWRRARRVRTRPARERLRARLANRPGQQRRGVRCAGAGNRGGDAWFDITRSISTVRHELTSRRRRCRRT